MRKRFSIIVITKTAVIFTAALLFALVPLNQALEISPENKTGKIQAGASRKSPAAHLSPIPAPDTTRSHDPKTSTPKESYRLILRGTVNWDTPFARAVIEDADNKKQGLYKVGDVVKTGIIKKITRQNVIIGLNNKDIILSMMTGVVFTEKPTPQVEVIRRSEIEKLSGDVKGLLSQIGIKPHVPENGSPDCRLTASPPAPCSINWDLLKATLLNKLMGPK